MNLPSSCGLSLLLDREHARNSMVLTHEIASVLGTPAVQMRWLHTGHAAEVGAMSLLRAGHCFLTGGAKHCC